MQHDQRLTLDEFTVVLRLREALNRQGITPGSPAYAAELERIYAQIQLKRKKKQAMPPPLAAPAMTRRARHAESDALEAIVSDLVVEFARRAHRTPENIFMTTVALTQAQFEEFLDALQAIKRAAEEKGRPELARASGQLWARLASRDHTGEMQLTQRETNFVSFGLGLATAHALRNKFRAAAETYAAMMTRIDNSPTEPESTPETSPAGPLLDPDF